MNSTKWLAVTVYYFVIYLYKSYSYILNNDIRDVEAGGSNPLTPTKYGPVLTTSQACWSVLSCCPKDSDRLHPQSWVDCVAVDAAQRTFRLKNFQFVEIG